MTPIKRKNRFKTIALLAPIVFIFAFVSCKREKEKNSFINPPFEDLAPEFTAFTINTKKADTLVLGSGTKLFIPQNAFINAEDSIVSGEVKIKYREFHDALDIFLAGVPMNIDIRGENNYLQTAGMFEIRAYKDDEELNLAENKRIKIDMASKTPGPQYNFFGFNEDSGKWEFMGYPGSRANPEYKKTQENIEKLKNKRIYKPEPGYFIFDYEGALDVYKYDLRRDANDHDATKNRIKNYDIEWLNIDNRHIIYFEGNKHLASFMLWKKLSDKPFPKWLKEEKFFKSDMQRIKGNIYKVVIKKDKTFTATIKAIMPLKSLLAFTPEYWQKHYDEVMRKMKEEEKRLRNQAMLYRSFKLKDLGLFNFDFLYSPKYPIKVTANFKVNKQYDNNIYKLDRIYCLPQNNKTVMRLKSRDRLWLSPSDTNFRIITVLPDDKLGIYPVEKYRSLNFDSLRKIKHPEVDLMLEPVGEQIKSREQLERMLGF